MIEQEEKVTTMKTTAQRDIDERKMWSVMDQVWDSVRLPLMDMYFEGKVTKRQVRAIEQIVRKGFQQVTSAGADEADWADVVVKKFEVKPLLPNRDQGPLSVVVWVTKGRWEGTMASVMCEAHGHFFVGVRGAIEAQTGSASQAKRYEYPLIYGWDN